MKIENNSLVLYKDKPCRVILINEKIEIELEDKVIKVRPKDVMLLHPGPIKNLTELEPIEGDIQTAWELLSGQSTYLAELAELIYNIYTPATAWATWQLVMDGFYFRGTNPNEIFVCSEGQVANIKKIRQAKIVSEQAWQSFVCRMRDNIYQPEIDKEYLKDVELLAFEKQSKSRLLNELNIPETSENAHAFLIKLGHWDITINPYPIRANIDFSIPNMIIPSLHDDEARVDLTHLTSLAIDDEDTQDPDDALSFDQDTGKLWVHVADVAAIVKPDTELDLLARHRVSNIYLPEQIIPMLPEEATQKLALGLNKISPALSFGLSLDTNGLVYQCEIVRSWIRVTRCSYNEVELKLNENSTNKNIETYLYQIAMQNQIERQKHGAIMIKLPEVKVKVKDKNKITIQQIIPLKSRDLVTEAMLMAGQAAARFAIEKGIPFPFSTQSPPDFDHLSLESGGLAGMFALRKSLKRSELRCTPNPHSGLGLTVYSQVTSPLRRYLDLVAHQQIRSYLNHDKLLDNSKLSERLAATTSMSNLRQVERLSRQHWILVYLMQNSGQKTFSGVLVEPNKFLIPELDLEVNLTCEIPLNSKVTLKDNSSTIFQPKFKIVY